MAVPRRTNLWRTVSSADYIQEEKKSGGLGSRFDGYEFSRVTGNSTGAEEKRGGHDSANRKNHACRHEHGFHPRKRNANNRQHQRAQKHQRKPARPVFPAPPPLAWLVESAQSPEDQRHAQRQPAHAVPVNNSPVDRPLKTQPDQQSAEHHENQLDHDPQEPLRREHGWPSLQ